MFHVEINATRKRRQTAKSGWPSVNSNQDTPSPCTMEYSLSVTFSQCEFIQLVRIY